MRGRKPIDWEMIVEGYNDKYHTHYTEKEMWNDLYPKYTSHEIEKILGVNCMVILARLRHEGFKIQNRGRRRPTKLDKFRLIPRHIRGALSVSELASITGACQGTVMYYRVRYGG